MRTSGRNPVDSAFGADPPSLPVISEQLLLFLKKHVKVILDILEEESSHQTNKDTLSLPARIFRYGNKNGNQKGLNDKENTIDRSRVTKGYGTDTQRRAQEINE